MMREVCRAYTKPESLYRKKFANSVTTCEYVYRLWQKFKPERPANRRALLTSGKATQQSRYHVSSERKKKTTSLGCEIFLITSR